MSGVMDPPADLRGAVVEIGGRRFRLLSFDPAGADQVPLSPAQRHVASAILAGLSNAEIASLRGSSPRTVANQIAGLYRRLGVSSRAELAARWGAALSPQGRP